MSVSLDESGSPTRERGSLAFPAASREFPRWRVGLFLVCLSTATVIADDKSLRLHEFRETHLSVPVELRVYATDQASANAAARAAYDRIDELNAIFSDYDADSEIVRLGRAKQPTRVSPELFLLLDQSLSLSRKTDGAFDVTIAPLIKQWRRARRNKTLPTPDQIAAAKALIGYQKLKLNAADQTVEILQPGLQFDFGGIAKGYIAEEAYKVLEAHGCPRSLVSVAGDIFAGDPPPDEDQGWKIGIAPLDKPDGPPSRHLALKRQAVSTSGDAFQFVEIAGVRYSHIVDPHTGLGLTQRSSVTVIAPHGWMADGYATAVCLIGAEKGLKLIGELDEVEVLIVMRDENEELRTHESPGFERRSSIEDDLKRLTAVRWLNEKPKASWDKHTDEEKAQLGGKPWKKVELEISKLRVPTKEHTHSLSSSFLKPGEDKPSFGVRSVFRVREEQGKRFMVLTNVDKVEYRIQYEFKGDKLRVQGTYRHIEPGSGFVFIPEIYDGEYVQVPFNKE